MDYLALRQRVGHQKTKSVRLQKKHQLKYIELLPSCELKIFLFPAPFMAVMAICVQPPGAHLTSRDIEMLEKGSLLTEAGVGQWGDPGSGLRLPSWESCA